MAHAETPLALTLGDPAGIGPDITLLAWLAQGHEPIPPFVLLGDPTVLAARAELLGLKVPIATIGEAETAEARFAEELPVLPITVTGEVVPGRPNERAAPAVQRSIEQAVRLVQSGEARAVVTNPISKAVLYRGGFAFPGHTEYLAALAAKGGETPHPVMMLAADSLRVVPVTIHIPLKDVFHALSKDLILATIEITANDLRRYFGIARPRLAVSGLNPHAGEEGGLGREEIDIIAPAIEAARAQGLDVTGPHPADTMFHAAARATYDAAICMYHDQALIPLKTLAFDEGVNVTLGLPFIRTSPDHGTAFGIAGTGKSEPAQPDRSAPPCRRHEPRRRGPRLSTPDGLPPLREVIRAAGLSAKKSLGQNFLLDLNLTRRIARAAGPLEGVTIVEIGPGPGGLTRALLLEGAARVVAIERDERCLPALSAIAALYPGRLDIVSADAREMDYAGLHLPSPARIVANLPYSVGTPLLISWLKTEPWPPWFDRLVLMFQREVAERIVACATDQGLRAACGALTVADEAPHPLHLAGRGVHSAPQGRFGAGRVRPQGETGASMRRRAIGEGHGGGIRPEAQDAPLLAPPAHR